MIEMYKGLRKPGVEKNLAGSGREDNVSLKVCWDETYKDSGIYPMEEQDHVCPIPVDGEACESPKVVELDHILNGLNSL